MNGNRISARFLKRFLMLFPASFHCGNVTPLSNGRTRIFRNFQNNNCPFPTRYRVVLYYLTIPLTNLPRVQRKIIQRSIHAINRETRRTNDANIMYASFFRLLLHGMNLNFLRRKDRLTIRMILRTVFSFYGVLNLSKFTRIGFVYYGDYSLIYSVT